MDNVMSMISETKDRIRDASDNTEAMAFFYMWHMKV